jgi:hypothetical protein
MSCSDSPEHDAVYCVADEGDGRSCIALKVPGDYEEIRRALPCRPAIAARPYGRSCE